MAVARRQISSRPIRLLLIGMFAVPLVSLTALWGFAADITISSAVKDHNYNSAARAIGPTVQPLLVQLSVERQETYAWMSAGRRPSGTAALDATRHRTNTVSSGALAGYSSARSLLSAQGQAGLSGLYASLGRLGGVRASIDSGALSPAAAFAAYDGIADDIHHFMDGSLETGDRTIYQDTIGVIDAAYSLEMAGREAALADGTLAARHPMSGSVRQLFASTVASRRLLLGEVSALLDPSLRAGYASASAKYPQLTAMEDQISASPGDNRAPLPVNSATWQSVMTGYLSAMGAAQNADIALLGAMSAQVSDRLVTEAALASGLGLAALVISTFLLVWLGRRVTVELTSLLGSVRAMAEERLPRVVERLRRGDDVDAAAESPPPRTGMIREISRVAEAFSIVQAAAVAAAVDQAKLRKGISQVFLNLSMRNQSLLHRQLGMLDTMERRTNDPDALSDLFRLDHLTTRMRRHAEGLIILAGVSPGRGWRDPVPVVDVLRAAIAEVEDYVRVDMLSESRDLITGTAVNDVIHLVAELVENATAFSPPGTRVEVRADQVGTGLVAEIEDRGLGLDDEELADINQRLANPPEFDLADSNRLGLFIAGRLAGRRGIKVSLRRSPYGGTTAIILLPRALVVSEGDAAAPTAAGSAGGTRPALSASANGTPPVESPSADNTADQGRAPTFGPTGRHRMASLPTPRFPQPSPPAVSGDPERPASVPRAASAAPWDTPGTDPDAWQPSGPDKPGPATGKQQFPPFPPRERRAPASSGSHLGMPIRVPQASMAPQLRAQAQRGQAAAPRGAAEPGMRSPEKSRSMLLSMQQGWQRGRLDDLSDPDDVTDDGTDR